jgi:hypothetical protein
MYIAAIALYDVCLITLLQMQTQLSAVLDREAKHACLNRCPFQ